MKKKYLLLLIIILSNFNLKAQETTTYYLIRHAEKIRTDNSNKNPHLTKKGESRAKHWRTVFANVNFDMVFSTNYHRTLETATPTAKTKNIKIQFYNPRTLYNVNFQSITKGKTVLVVGHSNTTPAFVNKIIGENKYADIEDNNNSNLYIVTVTKNDSRVILLKIPYSGPTKL